MSETILSLQPGMPILYGGNQVVYVSNELAAAFRAGDRLLIVDGELLHVPRQEHDIATRAVDAAVDAFGALGAVDDNQITAFYEQFARALEDDACWGAIAAANAEDVRSAQARGRSTTRLAVTDKMRGDMIAGLRLWRDMPSRRGAVAERIEHDGWRVDQVVDGLGVVGFVFEGRPNVFADATGVLRGGNTVVFRIGSDALGTARAMMDRALKPALAATGLPDGSVELVPSAGHAAGWALFSDTRLALAVARGSGRAVAQLGSIARQAGIPVSLHGTGGAWLVVDETGSADAFAKAVYHSLDRKVCNSMNVCAIVRGRAGELTPVFLASLQQAGARRKGFRLHVAEGSESYIPAEWLTQRAPVVRAEGVVEEPLASLLPITALGCEWEWEETPETTLIIVDSVDEAIRLFNEYSPLLAASLISDSPAAHERFFRSINAPFVGNGFTRWVDGQFALDRPELGLSNWQSGRLFARGGVLSGDSVFTIRTRALQNSPDLHR